MRTIILCLAAALAVPTVASAQAKLWVSPTGAWASYAMGDVNRDVAAINATFADSGLALHLDEINHGFGFGLSAGVDLPGGLTLAAAYDRLSGSTGIGDGTSTFRFKVPANAFSVRGLYRVSPVGPATIALGLGLGRISEAGAVELSAPGGPAASFALSGSGPLVEGLVNGDWWAAPHVALTGAAGYRYAKVTETKLLGQTLTNADGSKYTVDYSGVTFRVGVKLGEGP